MIGIHVRFRAISFRDSKLKTSDISSPDLDPDAEDSEDLELDVEDLEKEAATASWALTVASEAFEEAFNALVRA